jgi:hypothetical protein
MNISRLGPFKLAYKGWTKQYNNIIDGLHLSLRLRQDWMIVMEVFQKRRLDGRSTEYGTYFKEIFLT